MRYDRWSQVLKLSLVTWMTSASLGGCGAAVAVEAPNSTTSGEIAQTLRAPKQDVAGAPPAGCVSGSVFFGVDSAVLDEAARSQLTCISRISSRVSIVGFTDPRGTEEYNLALGHERARAVAEHLGRLGYDSARIATSSLGEENAVGVDELGWRRDRHANFAAR
jgi:peptidoglycan-associated lipoprotein